MIGVGEANPSDGELIVMVLLLLVVVAVYLVGMMVRAVRYERAFRRSKRIRR